MAVARAGQRRVRKIGAASTTSAVRRAQRTHYVSAGGRKEKQYCCGRVRDASRRRRLWEGGSWFVSLVREGLVLCRTRCSTIPNVWYGIVTLNIYMPPVPKPACMSRRV